ncbi:hypothetical protein [Streptomyces sp. NPDC091416]|uniref:hypothetical protein n=1 Tax=Streptomyces sp. NPDC091416 TaxID=3366003 RepID=UPI003824F46A
MTPEPTPAPVRRAISPLDHRIEAATGHDIDTLWAYRDRGVLDETHAHLVDRHRELAKAQTGVVFYLKLLNRLSSGEFDVDDALFTRIDRTVDQLEEATDTRDAAARTVNAALDHIEAAGAPASAQGPSPLATADQAALLSIAGGAKVHAHLLTGRMSVPTSSGTRIPYAHLQQLEAAGLVSRDMSRPAENGQPLALTDTGRAALSRSRGTLSAATPPPRPGTWPTSPTRPHR